MNGKGKDRHGADPAGEHIQGVSKNLRAGSLVLRFKNPPFVQAKMDRDCHEVSNGHSRDGGKKFVEQPQG